MDQDLPINEIVCGEVRDVLYSWPENGVDLVVTSPPYWSLRNYGEGTESVWGADPECDHEWGATVTKHEGYWGKSRWQHGLHRRDAPEAWGEGVKRYAWCQKCGAWRGQLGLEPHPLMFVDHIVEVCRAIRRVMKPRATFFLNMGDTFYGSGGKGEQYKNWKKGEPEFYRQNSRARSPWLQPKQLLGIPERVMIALQDDGWILRNKIVWHKPNAMPESVKDRFTTSWELVMMLAKSRIYDFHLDNVRIPHKQSNLDDLASRKVRTYPNNVDRPYRAQQNGRTRESFLHPRGKNPGDVWRVMVRPSTLPHFASYPVKLVEKIIKAATEEGDIVLDPFVGSGTTTMVARKLRRRFIGVDIKPDYCEIAHVRTISGRYRSTEGVQKFTGERLKC